MSIGCWDLSGDVIPFENLGASKYKVLITREYIVFGTA